MKNLNGEDTSYIIIHLYNLKIDLVQMIDYVIQIYDYEEDTVPYQELRYNLITRDIDGFVRILKSILASVSYAISKTKEGYYHSNVHLILKLLGFNVISEECTNQGRIDAVIRFSDVIYIVEFKFSMENDQSYDALNQIKEKKYYQKFVIENKDIYAVGISFDETTRNINGHKLEQIFE